MINYPKEKLYYPNTNVSEKESYLILMPSRYFYFQMCWCAEFMLRQYISWSPHININWCNDEKPNQTMSSPRFCSAIQNYITRTSMTFWLIAPVQLDFSIDAEKVWNSHLPMAMSILSWNDLSTNKYVPCADINEAILMTNEVNGGVKLSSFCGTATRKN